MAGQFSRPSREGGLLLKLYVALLAGSCVAVCAYFRRSLSTGRHISLGPDHDLSEALLSGLLVVVVIFLVFLGGPTRSNAISGKAIGERKAIEATFYGIAGRLRGSVVPARWPQPPRVHFPTQGCSATLEYSSSDSFEGVTRVTVDLKGLSPGTLMIFPDGLGSFIPKLFGAQDLRVGDSEFDDRYVVQANPEWLVRRLFRADRRGEMIRSVRRLDGLDDATIHLTRETLTVRAKGYLGREAELLALAMTALDFTRFILELDPLTQVTWGETESQGGECRICGSALENRVVQCSKCQTLHHLDCWKYNGRCSIYACGETRYTVHSSPT